MTTQHVLAYYGKENYDIHYFPRLSIDASTHIRLLRPQLNAVETDSLSSKCFPSVYPLLEYDRPSYHSELRFTGRGHVLHQPVEPILQSVSCLRRAALNVPGAIANHMQVEGICDLPPVCILSSEQIRAPQTEMATRTSDASHAFRRSFLLANTSSATPASVSSSNNWFSSSPVSSIRFRSELSTTYTSASVFSK